MLIIFGGLPGVGKTTLARELARQLNAVYVRIDSIEQAMRDSAATIAPINDAGYCVGYAIAEDNLRLGRTVVADSVNPLRITRDAWLAVANRAQVRAVEIEVRCSGIHAHRQRVETRGSDIPRLRLPTWEETISREYDAWDREHVVIETADTTVEKCVTHIRVMLEENLAD